jgi:hypothetical protein
MRAFKILWLRSYKKTKEWLGGVVYECPWRAGGHNGLSNAENPEIPGNSYERVVELRKFLDSEDLKNVPIIMAGGVWNIKEYENWLDNPEIGNIAFQFGTRPVVTQESPASDYWKNTLLNLKEGDIKTNRFSPTGFYSSAINNELLQGLFDRLSREVQYKNNPDETFEIEVVSAGTGAKFFVKKSEMENVQGWIASGFSEILKTPDNTIIFVTRETAEEIKEDIKNCIGCLSCCGFSSWSQYSPENGYTSGAIPNPRAFCIQKALQFAKKGINQSKQLLFAGSNAYRFALDTMYKDGFIPTIGQLVDAIVEGN